MSTRKKPPAAGKGRKRGVPNVATREAREAFKQLVEGNVDRMQAWLDRVAKRNPARAIELMGKLAEFFLPKLARTEMTGPAGQPLEPPRIAITFPDGGPGTPITAEEAERAYRELMLPAPMPRDPVEASRAYQELVQAPAPKQPGSSQDFWIENGVEVNS